MRGRFVTFEGVEGSGKSTHMKRLAAHLTALGMDVELTREPGVGLGPDLRDYVLTRAKLHPASEAMFMSMDRHEHVERVIRPALEAGKTVLCDRFADSTFAYQGGGSGVDVAGLEALTRLATGGLVPDLTLLFDLPVAAALERVKNRAAHRTLDRFESEEFAFHERVRRTYLERASREPSRIVVIDSNRAPDKVFSDVKHVVEARFELAKS